MKEYFFAELRRRLSVMGIPSADPLGGWLPILWGGEPVVFVSRSGDVFFEKNHVGQKDIEDLYDMTADLAAEVKEYTTAVENSPQLKADRLDVAFRLLAEFNGTVFAGRKWQNDQGYQFVTWRWNFDRTGVTLGHYFEDHYAAAKEDFSIRSGLIEKEKIFSTEQMKEIHGCVREYLDSGLELSQKSRKLLESVVSQIEEIIPDQIGQTEQSSGMEMKG